MLKRHLKLHSNPLFRRILIKCSLIEPILVILKIKCRLSQCLGWGWGEGGEVGDVFSLANYIVAHEEI